MQTHASPSATASPHSAPAPLSKAMVRRIVFSSSVGNALEWFDFLVYGYFATIISAMANVSAALRPLRSP